MSETTAGATEALVRFIARGAPDLTPDHRSAVARLVVDTVGVAVAAGATTPVTGLRRWLTSEGLLDPKPGGAVIWGTEQVVAPSIAALVNATSGHALDWDDASPSIPSHPATVLVPAILACAPTVAAERVRPVGGGLVVRAFTVGSAVLRGLAEALPDREHYARGWHTTATVGRLAAVASLAVLVRLDRQQTRHALALATSMAAGSRANFGTDVKSVHAGLAAHDAVAAVGMARAGMTGATHILEQPYGLFALYGTGTADAARLADRLQYWENGWLEDYAIKVYPSCYGTHRPLDGLLRLRAEGLQAADVTSVHVTVETAWLQPLHTGVPASGLEAKFSLEYTCAVALLEGAVRLDDFTDAALDRPEVRELMAKVTSSEAEHPPIGGPADGSWAVVTVETTSGRVWQTRVDATRGDARNPLSTDELIDKFVEAVSLDPTAAADWARALAGVVDLTDLSELTPLLSGPSPSAPQPPRLLP